MKNSGTSMPTSLETLRDQFAELNAVAEQKLAVAAATHSESIAARKNADEAFLSLQKAFMEWARSIRAEAS